MSYSIEILPGKPLPQNWQDIFSIQMSTKTDEVSVLHIDETSFRLVCNNAPMFFFWLSDKDREAFPEESYIDALKKPAGIDIDAFLQRFKTVDYSIRLESKPARKEGEIELMVPAAKALAEITEGLILFDQNIAKYKANGIYLPEDLKTIISFDDIANR
jgi:hypothetical protein